MDRTQNQLTVCNLTHSPLSYLSSCHLSSGLSSSFFSVIVDKMYTFLISPMRAKWPDHIIFVGLITMMIMNKKYKVVKIINWLHCNQGTALFQSAGGADLASRRVK